MTRTERNRALREQHENQPKQWRAVCTPEDLLDRLADSDALEAAERERDEARAELAREVAGSDSSVTFHARRAEAAEALVKALEEALEEAREFVETELCNREAATCDEDDPDILEYVSTARKCLIKIEAARAALEQTK